MLINIPQSVEQEYIKMSSEFGTLYEDGDTIPEGKKVGDIKTTTGEKVRSVKGIFTVILN